MGSLGGLGISILKFLIKKDKFSFQLYFFFILVIKTLDPDPGSLKMLDSDPNSMNPDPQLIAVPFQQSKCGSASTF